MAGALLEPMPVNAPVIDQSGRFQGPWARWFLLSLVPRVQGGIPVVASSSLIAQTASIGVTNLVATANAALYRVNYYLQVTTVAGATSSLQLSVLTAYNGQTITQSSSVANGNSLTTFLAGSFTVRCDAGAAISFTVTYASNPASAMNFSSFLEVEAL